MTQTQALLLMLLPIVVMPFALTDFGSFFRVFHTFFFRNDNWLFDPATDPKNLLLPEAFFRNCAILILAAVLLCCAALIIADLCRRRRAS